MGLREIEGRCIEVDERGHLRDPAAWTEELARALARESGVGELSDKHWAILRFIQDSHRRGQNVWSRILERTGMVTAGELHQLFPGNPVLTASLIAGVPKPDSCITEGCI